MLVYVFTGCVAFCWLIPYDQAREIRLPVPGNATQHREAPLLILHRLFSTVGGPC